MYDVIIIGGGPIGLACGIEAEKRGLSYLIIEKGCLVNSIYNFPANMTFFSTAEKIEIGNVPFVAHNDKPTRKEALEYYRRVKDHWKLNLNTYETVTKVEKKNDVFSITTSKTSYKSKFIITATGFYDIPNLLKVKGEGLPKVKHYYDDPHLYIDHKVIVVGGGNSAADVALETHYKGAEVTVVVRKPEMKSKIKYWIKPNIDNRIKEGSIKAFFNSYVLEIREHEVDLMTPNGKITIENDFVLAMIGFQPNFKFLKMLGIEISDDKKQTPKHNEETFETNVKNLFLAGVVCGGMITSKWFIENARFHQIPIFNEIVKRVV
jgi:thioredoxin reductase (NADPH)